nr:MAG: major capsid protein [Microviridae sp.]
MGNELLHLNTPDSMSSQKNFSKIPQAQIQRSKFNRSHSIKTTLGAGFLVPFMADEVYPGDTYDLKNLASVIRLITPIVPFMDNLYVDWFFFFEPARLDWIHFNQFMGEQANPADTTSYLIPTLNTTIGTGIAVASHSPYDYMGVPPGIRTTTSWISAMYGRGFNRIWNKWFRDQNLQNSLNMQTGDGPDYMNLYQQYGVGTEVLPRRGKRHDYFTSCQPWPQKINDGTVVTLPLGTTAPLTQTSAPLTAGGTIVTNNTPPNFYDGAVTRTLSVSAADTKLYGSAAFTNTGTANFGSSSGLQIGSGTVNLTGITVNLSSATAATINQIRLTVTLQQLFEKDARGGTYLPEIIKNHFGVTSPDSRMQWPEYIGGGETPIQISGIPQTSATGITGGTTPQGSLAAFAAGHESGKISWTKSFVEHGILYGLMSIRADLTYQQGVRRQFGRSTRYSMYWPSFANIGEQSVNVYEIYFNGVQANDFAAFGYQEAWAELRYYPNECTAGMRSSASPTFDVWHLAQKFLTQPTLNATFIEDNPPIPRVTAVVTTIDQFYADIFVDLQCTRPLPVNSVPGLTRL